jgi:oligopeptide transport system substrate-binding protein
MVLFIRFISCLILILGGVSCSKGDALATVAAREKILIKGNGSEPRALDPHLIQTTTEHSLMMAMFEGLVNDDVADDDKVLPGVAESWESLDGASRWIFHLRANAKWSDGRPLVASDFVKSYQRELSPTFGALYADMLYKLKNAEDYNKGKITDFSQVGVKALDDHTLEVTLTGPMPYFLSVLSHFTWFPLPLHTIEKFGDVESHFNLWTRAGNMVGNGAFKLKTWKFKDYIEVERNPYYWDAAKVKLNGVRFMVISDLATEERLFRNGRLHVTETLGLDRIPYYRKNYPELLHISPYLGVYFYRINVTKEALKDVRVRQALNLALDRETLVNKTLQGAHAPAWGLTPPMQTTYKQPRPLTFDVAKAKQLLAEAGYPEGKGFPKFSLHVNDIETHVLIAQVMQDMWKRNLGLDVGIRTESTNVFYDTQIRMDYEISRAGWIADFIEPITFLDMWTKGNQNNNTGWASEEFDQLIRKSYTISDPIERGKVLEQAEVLFMNDLPIIPIYWYNKQALVHPAVKGWNAKLLDNHPWRDLDLGSEILPEIK